MKYIIEINDHEGLSKLTKLDDAIEQAEDRGYDKGYDEGYNKGYIDGCEDGREAMKKIVGKNLKRILCGDLNEKKFKPEVDGFDACGDCKHYECNEYEEPCSGCKHCHVDKYEPKE